MRGRITMMKYECFVKTKFRFPFWELGSIPFENVFVKHLILKSVLKRKSI